MSIFEQDLGTEKHHSEAIRSNICSTALVSTTGRSYNDPMNSAIPPDSSALPVHVAVLADEIVQWLEPRPGQTIVDGTCGAGGHAKLLAELVVPGGQVIALDRDATALKRTKPLLVGLPVRMFQANYCDLALVLSELGIVAVHGLLLDLGISSDQLADENRGFSFDSTGELDMRFDVEAGEPAWQLLQRLRVDELADLIFKYGEERHSRRIARAIVEARPRKGPWMASELAALIRRCVPRSRHDQIDPATRTFQALRIAVNRELESLETILKHLCDFLLPEGRVAIISFHSLEDRLVKWAFRNDPRWEILTKKPVMATETEQRNNPRSRSAKLRVARRRPA